jgi:small subunit ribosomal protein S8
MVDVIAELIIKLKNANTAKKAEVSFPYSKMREAILETLSKEGFVKAVSKKGKKVSKTLECELVYVENNMPKIQGVQQISKYSRRMYMGAKDIRPVRSGYGSLILTTPKGVLTDKEARKENVGGEPLFKIW